MSSVIKCPKCRRSFEAATTNGVITCPNCSTVLKLGGAAKDARRSAETDKNDNKTAVKLIIGLVVVFALFAVIALNSKKDDDTPKDTSANRKPTRDRGSFDEVKVPVKPPRASTVPRQLARQLLIALAEENEAAVEKLFWWDKLMSNLAKENNWEEARRYENQDEAGKDKMRKDFLFKVIDPDFAKVLKSRMLDDLRDDTAIAQVEDVQADWGNLLYTVMDSLDKPLVQYLIKVQLLDGKDSVTEAEMTDAWRIVAVRFEVFGALKELKGTKRGQQDFGAEMGKKPKEERKPRGPVGPPEADPKPVEWLTGTSQTMRSQVEGMIAAAVGSDLRASDDARAKLGEMGKIAIPGILNALAPMNHADNEADIKSGWLLVQILTEITGQKFGYGPSNVSTPGGFGMTHATPEERVKAIRRYFGWWEKSGPTFTKKAEVEDAGWGDEPQDGDGKKNP